MFKELLSTSFAKDLEVSFDLTNGCRASRWEPEEYAELDVYSVLQDNREVLGIISDQEYQEVRDALWDLNKKGTK